MKIIYLANARMPVEKAHGVQIAKMCEALALAGLEVELILPWRFNPIKTDIFEYYGIRNNFKVKKIFSLDLMPLEIPKICFWIQSLTFAISAFFYLFFRKADIVYSRDSFLLYLLSFFKRNFIYEVHTFPMNFFLHQPVFKKVKKIIVITQYLKQALIKKGISQDKIMVAPDGVDLEKFDLDLTKQAARQKLNLPLDKKIVLINSNLYQWKGVQVLAEASKFLAQDRLVVFLGGREPRVRKFKEKNKDLDKLLILGHQPYAQMPYYLKAADVLVLPNSAQEQISQLWTSPMKMFEYMAVQRPIVASDLPSLREVLNENNAILVEPDNPQNLAQGIERALNNSDFSDKILRQAYQDVRKYTWQKRVENILKFIG